MIQVLARGARLDVIQWSLQRSRNNAEGRIDRASVSGPGRLGHLLRKDVELKTCKSQSESGMMARKEESLRRGIGY